MQNEDLPELDSASENEAAPLSTIDWEEVRDLSVQPNGFGERRVELWYAFLLLCCLTRRNTIMTLLTRRD